MKKINRLFKILKFRSWYIRMLLQSILILFIAILIVFALILLDFYIILVGI